MRKNGGEAKEPVFVTEVRRLDGRDLVPAKALAQDIESAR
jgi:hypothetical protein